MKKYLLLALVALPMFSSAQTIWLDDFNDANLDGWTLVDSDGDGNNWTTAALTYSVGGDETVMRSASWISSGPLNPNNWAISPAINLSTYTPNDDLVLTWKVSAIDADWDVENYSVYVGTVNTVAALGATTPVFTEATLNNVNELTLRSVDMSSFAGQTVYVAFRHHGVTDQFTMEIDDVEVKNLYNNEASLTSLNMGSFAILNSATDVMGTITNLGGNTITSLEIKWTVDGGSTYQTQTLTGLSIDSYDSYDFTHSVPWTPNAASQFVLEVEVSMVNGVVDPVMANNSAEVSINVATQATTMMPLYEKFTSSTCGPCASFNNGFFNAHYAANEANVNLINYQVNWPGAGDPYYTPEIGVRRTFYGIEAAPTLLLNGKDTPGTVAGINAMLVDEGQASAYFDLDATYTLTGNTVTVDVVTMPYLTGNFVLHAVAIELLTTGNVASNGETSFKHVAMDMIPTANGTSITTVAGTSINTQLSADLSNTNVEEISDIRVVVFIQDNSIKQVMQSKQASASLSAISVDNSTVKVYPNPTNGIVSIATIDALDVIVFDTLGKQVYSKLAVENGTQLDLSSLNSGVYFMQLQNDSTKKVEKLVIK